MMASTPESIELYGLLVLKMDLKLLEKGIKRRHYNARTLAKRVLNLKTNKIPVLLEALEKLIEEKAENPAARFERV